MSQHLSDDRNCKEISVIDEDISRIFSFVWSEFRETQFEIEFPWIRRDTYCEIACVTHARAESPALRFALV